MKNKFLRFLIGVLFFEIFIPVLSAQTIQTDSFELFVAKALKDFDIPGLSVAIVKHDSVLYTKGFGVRDIMGNKPVDENTIFGIGSISKSFTALALGILVDEGKINWDDKVDTYLPYFKLYDPYVSDNFTIRDLLTHRSGLNEVSGGALWYHSDYSRKEIIERLQFLKPVSGFREKHAYQNVMYLVASEIVKAVSGMSWDDFLRIRVFEKLDMKNTTSVSTVREASDNIARPHILDNEFHPVVIEQEKLDNIAAAGGIYSSSKDMSKYIRMLLNNGVFEKDTIVSPKVLNEIFRPQIHFQIFDEPLNNEFTSYGFGWWLTPYKGHKIIEHSGGIDGMQADLIMIQDLDISMVILINSDDIGGFAFSVKFLEQVLNDEAFNLYDLIFSARKNMLGNIIALKAKSEKNHVKETKPSLDLDKYAGIYTDKMYGDIEIVKKNDTQLEIVFSHTPIFSGALKHWHYDTFQVDWYDMRIPDGFITFNFNFKREILGFSIHQKNLLDVDFGELDVVKKH